MRRWPAGSPTCSCSARSSPWRRCSSPPAPGAATRRSWEEAPPDELERCKREGRPVCVGMIDIDHFKAFNDSRGHPEGDKLLQRATTAWSAQVRDTDLLTRYGGEEFAVILR